MILRAYTIYDSKSLQYHSPWFAVSDGAACRNFQDLANDLNTMVGRHPRDYSLWLCGTYDDNNGHFLPHIPLLHIVDASALVLDQAQGILPLAQPERAGQQQPTPNGKDQ